MGHADAEALRSYALATLDALGWRWGRATSRSRPTLTLPSPDPNPDPDPNPGPCHLEIKVRRMGHGSSRRIWADGMASRAPSSWPAPAMGVRRSSGGERV